VTPGEEATSPTVARSGGGFGRVAAIGALALVLVAIVYLLLFSGGGGTQYRLLFETGGQLVKGNQVLIGGTPVGTVDEVKLTNDSQAQITISVDRTLHEGTQAVIRATSLSGIANRYVSIEPGPDNAPELADNAVITQVDTTSPVDLDQLFDALDAPSRKGLSDIIQGSATAYAGVGPEANATYKFLSPSLVATDRLLQELDRDQNVLTDFLVNGASVVSAVAERRDDLSALTSNANVALGAIARQNNSFDRALVALPPALRQANTTFFNLRAALDDLDPFVNATKASTKTLAPFLRQLKPVVQRSVPVFRDLRSAVDLQGKNNDLADAFAKLPSLENAGARAVPPSVQAMIDSGPTISFFRPYTPDLLAAVSKLGQITGYYDANGHYARVEPAGLGIFCFDGGPPSFNPAQCPAATGTLNPIPASQTFNDYGPFGPLNPNNKIFHRCPGGVTQRATDLSNPFVNPPWAGSGLTSGPPFPAGDCAAADLPLGP
jgi:phospholipid/cholesterol/gamma-HCH transport system substrate-binding protein